MKIDKNSSTPLYIQVGEWIKNQINQRSLKSGDRIPSENEVISILKVSRGTVRKAIDKLMHESILEQIHGKGTYVKNENISHHLEYGLTSFAESLSTQNIPYSTEIVTTRIENASASVSQKLRIPIGSTIFYMERVRTVNDEAIMFIENRINLLICPNIVNVDFTKCSLFNELEKIIAKKIGYSECRYSAKMIGPERAHWLNIHESSPVLHLEQLVYLENDIPIEFGNVWLKSNVNYLGTTLRRT